MKKKQIIIIIILLAILSMLFGLKLILDKPTNKDNINTKEEIKTLNGIIINNQNDILTFMDNNNNIYKINISNNIDTSNKYSVTLKYTGDINKESILQNINIIDCIEIQDNELPSSYDDNGIFKKYYKLAYSDIQNMTLDEKISQLLLVRHPLKGDLDIQKEYQFGGYVFFAVDFRNKDKDQVKEMINNLQKESKIPLITSVDEEGGRVVRISSNPKLSEEKFKSPRELYEEGGLDLIKQNNITKNNLLKELGLNVNLAPVVDVSTNEDDYMYDRSLGQDTNTTSEFAKIILESSKGSGISNVLKHFPGYGNNADTHSTSSNDTRTWQDIKTNDLPPFQTGIDNGSEAILISHNIIDNIDNENPSSSSTIIHNYLRNQMNFTGIIMTDDISMGAVSTINDFSVQCLLAGNDMIITTDYAKSIIEIKNAIENGTISEELINKLVLRVLSWKYYKGIMYQNYK